MNKSEGIVLQARNFQEDDKIISVFTLNEGVVKLLVKGGNRFQKRNATSTLTRAEFVYKKGTNDLWTCYEVAPLEMNMRLRHSLGQLEAACDMGHVLLQSQMLHIPAPQLYHLLLWSINKISLIKDPFLLAASFRLKLLKHEGLLRLQPSCSRCNVLLKDYYIAFGETFCASHAPPEFILFSPQEMEVLIRLLAFSNFREIAHEQLIDGLYSKIKQMYLEQIGTG